MEMELIDIGKVKGRTALCLGKNEMVQLDCYTLASEYPKYASTIESIIGSFRFDEGREYEEDQLLAQRNQTMQYVVGGLMIGSIVIAIFAFARKAFTRSRKPTV
jgi:hypothetical protein